MLNLGFDVYFTLFYCCRSSSPSLCETAIKGISSLNGHHKDFGIVTTPFLHYMVYCKNTFADKEPDVNNYNTKLITSFKNLNNYKLVKIVQILSNQKAHQFFLRINIC